MGDHDDRCSEGTGAEHERQQDFDSESPDLERENWLEDLVSSAVTEQHPVPPEAVEAAAALFDFVNFEASIAEVIESELAVRSQSTRSRTFKWADRRSLVLETVASAGRTLLTGVVIPSVSEVVTLRTPSGEAEEVTLIGGTFELSTPAAMVRLELDGGSFVTPWFRPN